MREAKAARNFQTNEGFVWRTGLFPTKDPKATKVVWRHWECSHPGGKGWRHTDNNTHRRFGKSATFLTHPWVKLAGMKTQEVRVMVQTLGLVVIRLAIQLGSRSTKQSSYPLNEMDLKGIEHKFVSHFIEQVTESWKTATAKAVVVAPVPAAVVCRRQESGVPVRTRLEVISDRTQMFSRHEVVRQSVSNTARAAVIETQVVWQTPDHHHNPSRRKCLTEKWRCCTGTCGFDQLFDEPVADFLHTDVDEAWIHGTLADRRHFSQSASRVGRGHEHRFA